MDQSSDFDNKSGFFENLFVKARTFLAEPRIQGIDLDSSELLVVQRKMLEEKKMLQSVFNDFYKTCRKMDEKHFSGDGLRVEIGAGVSRFKDLYPDILSTDIKPAEHLDQVVDAQKMPFEEASVRSIYAINCFHHIPQPELFFKELNRVLSPGGGCVIIDPYYGPLASKVFKSLFDSETFDKAQKGWNLEQATIMHGANQALSYIVFIRDKGKFQKEFSELEIVEKKTLGTTLRYFLSGGVNFKQLLPDFSIPAIKSVEKLLSPLEHFYAMNHVVVLRKKK